MEPETNPAEGAAEGEAPVTPTEGETPEAPATE